MHVFDFPLHRHTLVDGCPRKWVSESVEPIVENVVVVNELDHVTLLEFS